MTLLASKVRYIQQSECHLTQKHLDKAAGFLHTPESTALALGEPKVVTLLKTICAMQSGDRNPVAIAPLFQTECQDAQPQGSTLLLCYD
jgi:hypothetical protein